MKLIQEYNAVEAALDLVRYISQRFGPGSEWNQHDLTEEETQCYNAALAMLRDLFVAFAPGREEQKQ